MANRKQRSILPGFGLSLGYCAFYASLIVLIPLSGLVWKSTQLSWPEFWQTVAAPRVLASFKLSAIASLLAAAVNMLAGLVVAWTLVRYRFPGRRLIDAMIDLPFALPTAVAGIALTTLYAKTGWIGAPLDKLGIHVAYTPLGIWVAMLFIGLPFVVRTLQPVIEELDPATQEAAECLGASPSHVFWRVQFPELVPALLTGFALAFARAVGEYGSIVFISGNMPMRTEIPPLLIMTKLEQFQYAQATSIALVMLALSFAVLLAINLLQRWAGRRIGVLQ